MLDLNIGFYVEFHPWGQIPRSKILHPVQNMRKFMLYEISGSQHTGFVFCPKVLEGLESSGTLVGTISTYPGTSRTLR